MGPKKPKPRGAEDAPAERPLLADEPVPDAEIPELKKREEERKGAGVPVWTGSGAGAGRVVVGWGPLGSGRIAAAFSRALGGKGTFLGTLFASKLGTGLVLGTMSVCGMVLAVGGLRILAPSLPASAQRKIARLPGISTSGIVIDSPRGGSLGHVHRANKGEIRWGKKGGGSEGARDAAGVEEGEGVQDGEPEIDINLDELDVVKSMMGEGGIGDVGGLDREGFVKKMTDQVGGAQSGGRLRAGLAGFDLKKSFMPQKSDFKPMKKGKAKKLKRGAKRLASRKLNTRNATSSRAMGQLKFARRMSHAASQSATMGESRSYATDAFEQGKTDGGEMVGVDAGGIVVPPGEGAPSDGLIDGDGNVDAPNVGPGTNVTPYQGNLDAAKGLDNASAQMKNTGMMMMIIAIALIAIGIRLLPKWPVGTIIGAILIAIGGALLMMAINMMNMSADMADMAKQQGDVIEEQYGQEDQAEVVDECADAATGSGTKAEDCRPSQGPEQFQEQVEGSTIHDDVMAEQESTYELEDGGKKGE